MRRTKEGETMSRGATLISANEKVEWRCRHKKRNASVAQGRGEKTKKENGEKKRERDFRKDAKI